MGMQDWDVGKSEGHSVMEWIRVSTLPGAKASRRPTGASLQEHQENWINEGKQMTPLQVSGAPSTLVPATGYHCRIKSIFSTWWVNFDEPLRCLSLVTGNCHAGFLGEPGGGNTPWFTRLWERRN